VELLGDLKLDPSKMSEGLYQQFQTINSLGHGFILTGMLWGAFDRPQTAPGLFLPADNRLFHPVLE